MPELPEVETTLRGIQPKTEHQTIQKLIIRNPSLRWPVPMELCQNLPGRGIGNIKRRAKYLLLEVTATENSQVIEGHILIHLGMSGNLRILPHDSPVQKHDHIDLVLNNGWLLRLHDPRRFGAFLWTDQPLENHPLLKHLAPEPLSDDFTAAGLFPQLVTKSRAIKTVIMDNHFVVGVGNIYASESLFLSGIHPSTPANQLHLEQLETLVRQIKIVLGKAIEQGGTTLKDFLTPDGKPGYFDQQLFVYGREGQPCLKCGQTIERIVQTQRASYFCGHCQPIINSPSTQQSNVKTS